jgi:hypothetical protein
LRAPRGGLGGRPLMPRRPALGSRRAAAIARPRRVVPSSEDGGRSLRSPDRLRWTMTEPAITPSSSRAPEAAGPGPRSRRAGARPRPGTECSEEPDLRLVVVLAPSAYPAGLSRPGSLRFEPESPRKWMQARRMVASWHDPSWNASRPRPAG